MTHDCDLRVSVRGRGGRALTVLNDYVAQVCYVGYVLFLLVCCG